MRKRNRAIKLGNTQVNEDGVCLSCGEKLASIDIDPKETENFAASLSKLACQKEAKANFVHFQVEQNSLFCLEIVWLLES